jgi:hypothetical protein
LLAAHHSRLLAAHNSRLLAAHHSPLLAAHHSRLLTVQHLLLLVVQLFPASPANYTHCCCPVSAAHPQTSPAHCPNSAEQPGGWTAHPVQFLGYYSINVKVAKELRLLQNSSLLGYFFPARRALCEDDFQILPSVI